MKNKEKIIPIAVSLIVFIVFIVTFLIINRFNKTEYSCYDYENNKTYTFKTEEEMHQVCDNLNTEEDQLLETYSIYNDLINTDEQRFAFYPYINSDKKLSIVIAISDCDDPISAKEQAEKWFSNHSYNINDYSVEYEYPCDIE